MKIKIFIASSVTEFESDRMDFAIFLNKLNSIFGESYGSSIYPFICEASDHAVSGCDRKQNDYNAEIADSDVVIFLVGGHLGVYTKEEFEFSCNKYKESNSPKIYVYFCDAMKKDGNVDSFKKLLENTYQHYYDTFEYIDTVKLSTLFNLRRLLLLKSMVVKVKEDYFYIDNKRISQEALSPQKIGMFNNNKKIKELTRDLSESDSVNKNLIQQKIDECRNDILNVFLDAANYSFSGEFNPRVTEALRLLENGDEEEAIVALDNIHNRERRAARRKRETFDDIERIKLEIDIRKTHNGYDKIDNLYEDAVEFALEDRIGLQILYDYANWLNSTNRVDKAVKIAEQYKNVLDECTPTELNDNNISNWDLVNLQILFGVLYRRLFNFQMAYSSYENAFQY